MQVFYFFFWVILGSSVIAFIVWMKQKLTGDQSGNGKRDDSYRKILSTVAGTEVKSGRRRNPAQVASEAKEHLENNEANLALEKMQHLIFTRNYNEKFGETEALSLLADIFVAIGQYKEAYAEYLLLAKKNPDQVEYLHKAAQMADKMGQSKTAEAYYREAIEKKPNYGPSYAELGKIYSRKGLFEHSLPLFIKALQGGVQTPELYLEWGKALVKTGKRYQEGVGVLERCLQYDSDCKLDAVPYIVEAYTKTNKHNKALEVIE